MTDDAIGFRQVKVIALAVSDRARARHFYVETLGLPAAFEAGEEVGCQLGGITLMFKDDWYGRPTDQPNPRLTLAVADAAAAERALRARGVTISDPVQGYGDSLVGGFLDSEGNKLWFCSDA
jgi:catechol 2,3-dioxygenase-like lactoylglutathione lyase family enzyme